MANQRQPIDLIKAKGKKHLTEKEYEDRKKSEIAVPFNNVAPPDYLTAKQQEQFNYYAGMLLQLNIFTELDVEALARHILAKDLFLEYTKKLKGLLKKKDADLKELNAVQQMQDKAFRQTVTSANELCLNISSRAKLVIPPPPDADDDEL